MENVFNISYFTDHIFVETSCCRYSFDEIVLVYTPMLSSFTFKELSYSKNNFKMIMIILSDTLPRRFLFFSHINSLKNNLR